MQKILGIIGKNRRGVTTLLVIAFMGIFFIILGTLTSYVLQEGRYGRAIAARESALHIAESGLEYYRWYLAHNPNDLTNGTGSPGPYTYTVTDPETNETLGSAAVTINGNTQCGVVQSIDITSKGTSDLDHGYPRTLIAHYMQPSVAGYSYLLNSNVWAGPTRTITGPYFSNGGIRMDGTNYSDVSSKYDTWTCDSGSGCPSTQNGVFGAGSGSALWHNKAASIDFNGITANLSNLKGYAKNNGGIYLAPAGSTSTNMVQHGYHLIFKSDGTFDVYKVTATNQTSGTSPSGSAPIDSYDRIKTQSFVANYTIPPSCSVIFVEDRVWVEGVVGKKVTVASADFSNLSDLTTAWLPNNITYNTYDGSVGLTVIASGDVLLPSNSPDIMEIHGIFIAQNGSYGRANYSGNVRSQLTTIGTVVSNQRTGTAWINGSGTTVSGYQTRIDSYDQLQATNPPPFTPTASVGYKFISWREQ